MGEFTIFFILIILLYAVQIILEINYYLNLKRAMSILKNSDAGECAFLHKEMQNNNPEALKKLWCLHPKKNKKSDEILLVSQCKNCDFAMHKVEGLSHKDYINIVMGRIGLLRGLYSATLAIIPICYAIVRIKG